MNYAVLKEILFDEENGAYTAYGIEGNEGGMKLRMGNISCVSEKVECLVRLLNLWELPGEAFPPLVRSWVES